MTVYLAKIYLKDKCWKEAERTSSLTLIIILTLENKTISIISTLFNPLANSESPNSDGCVDFKGDKREKPLTMASFSQKCHW